MLSAIFCRSGIGTSLVIIIGSAIEYLCAIISQRTLLILDRNRIGFTYTSLTTQKMPYRRSIFEVRFDQQMHEKQTVTA
jgi:hypothetical protein